MQPKPGFPEVWQPMFNAMMMSMMGKGSGKNGLRSFAPDLKVWVGGMPPNNVTESNERWPMVFLG